MLDLYKTQHLSITGQNKRASKYIIIDESYVYIKIRSIINNGYQGVVYDYEVDSSHSFCSILSVMHNTPWSGGRIEYYRPSWYRRLMSGHTYTDDTFGSPLERLAFGHDYSPLAPLDPYHYEEKHRETRPYPVSSDYFTGPWGPLTGALNATVGKVLKPTKMMHEEELNQKLSQYQQVGATGIAPAPFMGEISFNDDVTGSTIGSSNMESPPGLTDGGNRLVSGGGAYDTTSRDSGSGGGISSVSSINRQIEGAANQRGSSGSSAGISSVAAINTELEGAAGQYPYTNSAYGVVKPEGGI